MASDTGVFVDNGFADRRVRPHAEGNGAVLSMFLPLGRRFVVVCAHQERLLDHTAGFDARAQADDRALHRTFLQNTALAEHGLDYVGVEQLRRGQMARARVDRRLFIIEAERRHRLRGQREIGMVERVDRPDIFPVILEQICLHIVIARRRWEDVFAEIRARRCLG